MEFKDKLKKLRKERGISQQALADAIFVSRSAIAKWENGLGLPGADSMEALTAFFSVPMEEIQTEEAEAVIVEKNRKIRTLRAVLGTVGAYILTAAMVAFGMLLLSGDYGFTPEMAAGAFADQPYIENDDYIIYYYNIMEPPEYACIEGFKPVRKAFFGYYVDEDDYESRAILQNLQYVGELYSLKGKDCYYNIIHKNISPMPAELMIIDEVRVNAEVCPVELNTYFVTEEPVEGFWIGETFYWVHD